MQKISQNHSINNYDDLKEEVHGYEDKIIMGDIEDQQKDLKGKNKNLLVTLNKVQETLEDMKQEITPASMFAKIFACCCGPTFDHNQKMLASINQCMVMIDKCKELNVTSADLNILGLDDVIVSNIQPESLKESLDNLQKGPKFFTLLKPQQTPAPANPCGDSDDYHDEEEKQEFLPQTPAGN